MRLRIEQRVLFLLVIMCFISIFIINNKPLEYKVAATDTIVLDENRVVEAIPKGKIYIEDKDNTYETLYFDTSRNGSLFVGFLIGLIDDETYEYYILPGTYLDLLEQTKDFPLYFIKVNEDEILLSTKLIREDKYYQMYKKTLNTDNLISKVIKVLKLSKDEESFKDYIEYIGLNIDGNIINITGVDYYYDFNSKTLNIKRAAN